MPSAKPAAASLKASKSEELPPAELDLSLPEELHGQLNSDQELSAEQPLLPELFREKPAEPSPYQLNGRLITSDKAEDYLDSVEGAELQIKIRN